MHDVPGVAQTDRVERLVVVPESIHVYQPRRGQEQGEHVAQRHGHEHHVGRSAHVPLAQHDHYEGVGDYRHHEQIRHHVTVQRHRILGRRFASHIDVLFGAGVERSVVQSVVLDGGVERFLHRKIKSGAFF